MAISILYIPEIYRTVRSQQIDYFFPQKIVHPFISLQGWGEVHPVPT
jgi:hypothetical protein